MNTQVRDFLKQNEREEKTKSDNVYLDEANPREAIHRDNNHDLDDEFDVIRSIN
ncbi:hypothetical protein [Legionella fallonii]|uniref:Uncharacterized protein n=1 Tax=Legionella fallonii LLAP-10 TaxID=1212491 RepID=A0A098GCD7_9GAMM|nr:hypothetical protein [Legionella fallonii]CEG59146.1 conserved protein of unknown function [Legionella fallonii LLAP-10]